MQKKEMNFEDKYIKWFSDLGNNDIKIAGGKGASLGEMYNNKFPVPPGFVVTAHAFEAFIEESGLKNRIKDIILSIDFDDTSDLTEKAKQIREMITMKNMPEELRDEILEAYHILSTEKLDEQRISQDAFHILKNAHEPIFVSVRSSATTEDLADASFAGQQDSFLNVKGESNLIEYVKKCFASLYNARALYYRNKKGFLEEEALLAVVVQKMVDSEKSGVMFSKDPMNLDDRIIVEAVFGLGEGIVSGKIQPDNYIIEDLKIKKIKVSNKKIAIIRKSGGENEIVRLTSEKSQSQVLNNGEILELANYALKLEEHYKKPQDIEFGIEANKIYILQSRPITTKRSDEKQKDLSGKIILEGLGASPGIGVGIVRIIKSMDDLPKIKKGDILVTEMTNPDMVVSMQKSVAIITNEGGLTSHASIVSREMGIPAIVGTGKATSILKDGMKITVDGSNGKVYEGEVAETSFTEIKPVVETETINLKVIVDLPEFAERAAKSKVDSIGLTRIEGMIASMGKHPLLYEKENKLEDYTKILEHGIEKIINPFKLMWIRSSDIRTDEYGSLEGAPEREINPMMGFHGIRFSLKHPKIFKAEIEAIKRVAEKNPEKKLGVMFPQIISIDEIKKTKEIFTKYKRKNMQFGVMIETPAAVQIIEDICKEDIDFISFGTNDLTQFTLGVDRGEDEVQYLYNELHPAVLSQIKQVIEICKKYNIETSICGQAGSNLEMVRHLLNFGINSISVNADAAYEISVLIKSLEKKEAEKKQREHEENMKNIGMTKKPELLPPLKEDTGLLDIGEVNEIKEDKKEEKRKETGENGNLKDNENKREKKNKKRKKYSITCSECGKESEVPFKPKEGRPVYCKECHLNKKNKEIKEKSKVKIDYPIKAIDNTEHIKEKAEEIKKEIEEQKQDKIENNKEIEQEIEITKNIPEENTEYELGSKPDVFEDIGVYNPDDEDNLPEKMNYKFDDEDVYTDVF